MFIALIKELSDAFFVKFNVVGPDHSRVSDDSTQILDDLDIKFGKFHYLIL